MASLETYLIDALEAECPDITGKKRKRNRRRNKHVNPTTSRNLVPPPKPPTPPPPPPKCNFREPRPKDKTSWVIMVRVKDEEHLHAFEEELPFIPPTAGIMEAGLKMYGLVALIYVFEEERATLLLERLKKYNPVFIGRTRSPLPRKRCINIHGLPEGIQTEDVEDMLSHQFPTKGHAYDLLYSHNARRKQKYQISILTNDSDLFHQLIFCGGLRVFDERLAFKCSEHLGGPLDGVMKPKAKVMPLVRRQCFRCLGYGHMAEDCKEEARCKRCGGSHDYRQCEEKDAPPACLNCGSDKHCTTSRSCPLRPGGPQKKGLPCAPSPGEENRSSGEEGGDVEEQLPGPPPSPPARGGDTGTDGIQSDVASCASSSALGYRENFNEMATFSLTTRSSDSNSGEESAATTVPAEGPGVSSTTVDEKKQKEDDGGDVEEDNSQEAAEIAAATSDKPEESEKENVVADTEDSEKETEGLKDAEEKKKTSDEPEDVHVFTGTDDVDSKSTATAVASFFSDLFGAADSPSEPLTGKFVATLRSLQESVYEDIASRQPRRGPTSPRERKPAKKRRLEPFRNREPDFNPAPADVNGPTSATPASHERRVRLIENFLYIVSGLMDLEIE